MLHLLICSIDVYCMYAHSLSHTGLGTEGIKVEDTIHTFGLLGAYCPNGKEKKKHRKHTQEVNDPRNGIQCKESYRKGGKKVEVTGAVGTRPSGLCSWPS